MVSEPARICAVWVGSPATMGLLTKRIPNSNVEAGGGAKGKEDPKIVGKQTEVLVFRVYPALEDMYMLATTHFGQR